MPAQKHRLLSEREKSLMSRPRRRNPPGSEKLRNNTYLGMCMMASRIVDRALGCPKQMKRSKYRK